MWSEDAAAGRQAGTGSSTSFTPRYIAPVGGTRRRRRRRVPLEVSFHPAAPPGRGTLARRTFRFGTRRGFGGGKSAFRIGTLAPVSVLPSGGRGQVRTLWGVVWRVDVSCCSLPLAFRSLERRGTSPPRKNPKSPCTTPVVRVCCLSSRQDGARILPKARDTSRISVFSYYLSPRASWRCGCCSLETTVLLIRCGFVIRVVYSIWKKGRKI